MSNIADKTIKEIIPDTYKLTDKEPQIKITHLIDRKAVIEIEIMKKESPIEIAYKEVLKAWLNAKSEDPIRNEIRKGTNPSIIQPGPVFKNNKEEHSLTYAEDHKDGSFPIKRCSNCSHLVSKFYCKINRLKNECDYDNRKKYWKGELRGDSINLGDKCWCVDVDLKGIVHYRLITFYPHNITTENTNRKFFYNKDNAKIYAHKLIISGILSKGEVNYTKIWFGNNLKLKELIKKVFEKAGLIEGNNSNNDKTTNFLVGNNTYYAGDDSVIDFDKINATEFNPIDIDIMDNEYIPSFYIKPNVPLYAGDTFYIVDVLSMKLCSWGDGNNDFKVSAITDPPSDEKKYFTTKQEAEEWIESKYKEELMKLNKKFNKNEII